MLSLNFFFGFFLKLHLNEFLKNSFHYISSLADPGFCLTNANLLPVYEGCKPLCILKQVFVYVGLSNFSLYGQFLQPDSVICMYVTYVV